MNSTSNSKRSAPHAASGTHASRLHCGCGGQQHAGRRAWLLTLGRMGALSLSATPMAWLLSACEQGTGGGAQANGPLDFDRNTACALDGMVLADYPGPKGQLQAEGEAQPLYYCDTVELLSTLLRPEQVRAIRAAYVQDMGKADWREPRGHWIDAKTAWYVVGSRRHGSMGPTIAPFAQQSDAQAFAREHGGQVLAFSALTPDMVDLSGGATHDGRM